MRRGARVLVVHTLICVGLVCAGYLARGCREPIDETCER
jgi:hypothetical protein